VAVLPDVLTDNLSIVFCGSAAGHRSARVGAYYAGPGNRFWPTLSAAALTPRRLAPHEFRSVVRYGLGLTDLCKDAYGRDSELPVGADDKVALRSKILGFRPKILAFVGKRPAAVFLGRPVHCGLQPDRVDCTRIFVLPSPSGAARGHWDEAWWHQLAALRDDCR
jgi:TDG/mug DNA glycosylase family protein